MDNPTTQPDTGVEADRPPAPATTVEPPKWYKDLPDHLVNGVSKFESPSALAEGYVNAQKLIGKRTQDLTSDEIKGLLTPQEIAEAFITKGLPKTPEEYVLPNLDQYLKPEIGNKLKTVAHENGMTPKAVESMIDFYTKQQQEDLATTRESWRTEVFAKYGNGLPKELEYAQKAIEEFGGAEIRQELDQTGLGDHPMVIGLFAKLGRSMMEDKMPHASVSGSSDKNNKLEINKLLANPDFMRKWKQGDKVAVAQFNALYGD